MWEIVPAAMRPFPGLNDNELMSGALTRHLARRQDHSDHLFIRHGLDHALAAGRFIRWAEGGGNWAAT